MYKEIKTEVLPLTPQLAETFATMTPVPGERNWDMKINVELHQKLKQGGFYSPEWAWAELDGIRYRVNGQHSSKLLAYKITPDEFPDGMKVTIRGFACENPMDLRELFQTFDRKAGARTDAQITSTYAKLYSELEDIKPTPIRNAVIGYWCYQHLMHGVSKPRRGGQATDTINRMLATPEVREFVVWAHPHIGVFSRQAMVAAMYATWTKDPDQAAVFWEHVRKNNHPNEAHPTRTLNEELREVMRATGKMASKEYPPRRVFVECIHAWNAYRRRRDLRALKYFADKEIPTIR